MIYLKIFIFPVFLGIVSRRRAISRRGVSRCQADVLDIFRFQRGVIPQNPFRLLNAGWGPQDS